MKRSTLLVSGLVSAVASAALFAAACGDGGQASSGGNSGSASNGAGGAGASSGTGGVDVAIESLTIDPPMATLTVDQTTPKSQTFVAKGKLVNGTTQDVPATFSVDIPDPGSIDAKTGIYTTSNKAGGLVHVTAAYGGKTATADLTVILQPSVSEGNVPPGTPDAFDPDKTTAVDDPALSFVYPSAGTMFPTNVYRILFQWKKSGYDLFHVRFKGEFVDLSIYTDGAHPTCVGAQSGGSCWEATLDTWQWLASSAAGKEVEVSIEAVDDAMPGKRYVGKSMPIQFSMNAVPGAIYYWSTTQAGVMRATVSDAAPSGFLTPTQTGECVACHTLSRNGKRLAADVGGENLWVVKVTPEVPPPTVFDSYNNKNIPSAWATFNPEATRVVSAKGGVLKLFDGETGAPIGANGGVIALAPLFGTQPDWSPDGKFLAFAYGKANKDRGIQGSSLAMLENVGNDGFANLVVVRKSAGNSDTYGYPMFDPTGQWIAYMHAAGASDNNAAAKLYVAKAQADAQETELAQANTIVGDAVVLTGIANNMPTWAPTQGPDETRWIAFASKRDYGLVLSKGSKYGAGRQQLWVAAIDPKKLGQEDPSFPAFRLPFQLLSEDNHRPFWAEDALQNECDGGDCGGTGGGGPGDAGTDVACKLEGEDCATGACCAGLYCAPNAQGTAYVCQTIN